MTRHTETKSILSFFVMPKRKREPTEEEKAATRKKRQSAGKRAWDRKTPEEKQIVLNRLAAARAKRGPSKRAIRKGRKTELEQRGYTFRKDIHQDFLNANLSKTEARKFIQDLRIDLGLVKRGKRKQHRSTALPELRNPLPKFFGESFNTVKNFLVKRTKQHFEGLFTYFRPIVEATGIVPPGTPLYEIFLQAFK